MRHLYAERHDALRRAAARFCGDTLVFGDSDTGLHVTAELRTVRNDTCAARAALERGVEVAPLSHYYYGPTSRAGLVLGFAAVDPPRIIAGMRTLADAIRSVSESIDTARGGMVRHGGAVST
jgi:GntR family transcriptional regulator/MocR family aminotransferase